MRFGIGWIGKMLLLLLGPKDVLKEALMLEGKQGVRPWMILMVTTRISSKVKRIKLH
jgi:hypothetical protein